MIPSPCGARNNTPAKERDREVSRFIYICVQPNQKTDKLKTQPL